MQSLFKIIIKTVFAGAMLLSIRAYGFTYVVQRGDTLSKLAQRYLGSPVYPKGKGSLARALNANPAIHDPNLLLPGSRIELEAVDEPSVRPVRADSAVRAPASDPVVPTGMPVGSGEFKRTPSLRLAPSFLATSLTGVDYTTGSQATVATNLFFKLNTEYFQNWNENFRSYVALDLGYAAFERPTDAAKSIEPVTKFLSGMRIGALGDLSDAAELEGFMAYEKELFLRSLSTRSVAIDSVSVPSLGVKLSYALFEASPFTVGVRGMSAAVLPGSTEGYQTKVGVSYGGMFYLSQDSSKKLETSVGFFQRRQNTSLVRLTETDLVLSVTIHLGD
jgi:hypothetical protein